MKTADQKGDRPSKTPTSSTSPAPRKKKPRRRAKTRTSPKTRQRGKRRSRVRLRRVLPGTTYIITKKTNDDLFLIRPDGKVDAVLLYLLLEKLTKYGLLLHEFVFMSNHFHLVVTDLRGTLPDFMREFLSETGKALKGVLETTRRIWSGDRYGSTSLLDLDAAERSMVYTRVNPTKAGLTEPAEWPGLTSARFKYGDTIEVERPDGYFDRRTRADRVSCVLEPLPERFGEAAEGSAPTPNSKEEIDEEVEAKERAKHRRRCASLQKKMDRRTEERVTELLKNRERSNGATPRTLAGASRVRNASRLKRGNHHHGRLNPHFASKDPERLLSAIEAELSFLASHERARKRFLSGESNVLFPAGTYGYREL